MNITICVGRQVDEGVYVHTLYTPSGSPDRAYEIAQQVRVDDHPRTTWTVIDYSTPPAHLHIPTGTGPVYRLHAVIRGLNFTRWRHESHLRPVCPRCPC